MDRASQVLADGIPEGMPNTYAALASHGEVPLSTLYHRARGRRSREEKAQSQQYLHLCEENAFVSFVLQQRDLGQSVHKKYLRSIAFCATRHWAPEDRPSKPPGENWPREFEKRHPELKSEKDRPQDWNRFHIYDKVVKWFEVM